MQLTTKDIRVNGYPPLDEVLAYFDAIPVLIEVCKLHSPETLRHWRALLHSDHVVARDVQPVTRKAEALLELGLEL